MGKRRVTTPDVENEETRFERILSLYSPLAASGPPGSRWVSVQQAADTLGTDPEAAGKYLQAIAEVMGVPLGDEEGDLGSDDALELQDSSPLPLRRMSAAERQALISFAGGAISGAPEPAAHLFSAALAGAGVPAVPVVFIDNPPLLPPAGVAEYVRLAVEAKRSGCWLALTLRGEAAVLIEVVAVVAVPATGFWYVAGWSEKDKRREAATVRRFRLDRAGEVRLGPALPSGRGGAAAELREEDVFQDAWAVDTGRSHDVRVFFQGGANLRVKVERETAHRPGRRLIGGPDGSFIYEDRVGGLNEFAAWLRTFGAGTRVLVPQALADRMLETGQRRSRARGDETQGI